MNDAPHSDCVFVEGDHPLYILYTSGTTGMPKGIVRDHGGTCVGLSFTMEHIMGIKKGDMYFAGSDIGWVVGHSFIVYGPLVVGCGTVLYEGKPHLPDAGQYWRLVQDYKVNGLYSSPTGLRCIRKADPEGKYIGQYDVSSLQNISMAGERFDVHTFKWLNDMLPEGVLVNDNYWQTESGWPICCNYKNLHTFVSKPGSCTKPAPGWDVKILDDDNNEITEPRKMGKLSIKLPLPPSFMLTLWGDDSKFTMKYLADSPGYYTSGDAGYVDEEGYVHVMTRLDDVINTAGHRLSTYQMEEVLIDHPDIVEAAVVSKMDDLKGEVPVGFVVCYPDSNPDPVELEKLLVKKIRAEIGPIACLK
jgi:propionyl-CoA synthetase